MHLDLDSAMTARDFLAIGIGMALSKIILLLWSKR